MREDCLILVRIIINIIISEGIPNGGWNLEYSTALLYIYIDNVWPVEKRAAGCQGTNGVEYQRPVEL